MILSEAPLGAVSWSSLIVKRGTVLPATEALELRPPSLSNAVFVAVDDQGGFKPDPCLVPRGVGMALIPSPREAKEHVPGAAPASNPLAMFQVCMLAVFAGNTWEQSGVRARPPRHGITTCPLAPGKIRRAV